MEAGEGVGMCVNVAEGLLTGGRLGKPHATCPCAAVQLLVCKGSTWARKEHQHRGSVLIQAAKSLRNTKDNIAEFTAQLMLTFLTFQWKRCDQRLLDCSSALKILCEFTHFADVGPECSEL